MVPIEQARALVLRACSPLAPRAIPLEQATGCVLGAEVVAAEDVPPFANTAVDGYAVRAADTAGASVGTPVELRVIGELAAGAATARVVGVGETLRIMTGAPLPAGADAAVMVENTVLLGDPQVLDGSVRVQIMRAAQPGDAVRGAGDDVHGGDRLFGAGTEIGPAVAGVLASVNCRHPVVHPRPRVAVLSTGDELVDDGSPLAPGQIRESNRVMLLGLVAATGAVPVDLGIVRDDEALLERVLREGAATCDAVVTSGGVSMGDYDVVKAVLGRIAEMSWMQIAIKPAKPFAFGLLRSDDGRAVPVFGLPGNPVSSLVSFELLARPGLRQMAGQPAKELTLPSARAVADQALRRSPDGKVHYQRAIAHFGDDGRVHVRSTWAQGSHQLAATAAANALVELPDGDGVDEGSEVTVMLLSPGTRIL
ncbi:MAG: molybdopterin molybdotransferase MoeA [Actinomycetota bacterium]|nr:MAG: molybdopterin molybdotransferase MoeA [Actinomycetota bacterium]